MIYLKIAAVILFILLVPYLLYGMRCLFSFIIRFFLGAIFFIASFFLSIILGLGYIFNGIKFLFKKIFKRGIVNE